MKIRKGDIVGRISYGSDILFIVDKIIQENNKRIAILKGMTIRIEATAPIEDLKIMERTRVEESIKSLDRKLNKRVLNISSKAKKINNIFKMFPIKDIRSREYVRTGKILHLDGDKRYTEKSYKHYRNIGLDAIVKNIEEKKQPFFIRTLLDRYKPDILVITGHDGMIKGETGYNDICNYKNSKYFIQSVQEARKWDINNNLVIFAGACQSFFEAIMNAGANFASSPARVLIDFADPLIVAERVATTDYFKYITINDIAPDLRDGTSGVGGVGANGKKQTISL